MTTLNQQYQQTLPYWLAAQHTPYLGSATLNMLLQHGMTLPDLFLAPKAQLMGHGLSAKVIHHIQTVDWQVVERDQQRCAALGAQILTWDHPGYPEKLKQLVDAPLILYAQGDLALLAQTSIAIVGSRRATFFGCQQAQTFASALAAQGIVITSGLARGIDGAAHAGALRVHGKTIAVFGTSLDHIYPRQHVALAEQIHTQGGLLLSEFPITTLPLPAHFPKRNRIISGLSQGILVVEATLKSGSLITAQLALEQGRDVYAIPGAITNPNAAGCHHLIQQGAALVQHPDDILQFLSLPLISQSITPAPAAEDCLSSAVQRCLNCIDYAWTDKESIYQRYGGTIDVLQGILLELEMQGLIYWENGGYVRIALK